MWFTSTTMGGLLGGDRFISGVRFSIDTAKRNAYYGSLLVSQEARPRIWRKLASLSRFNARPVGRVLGHEPFFLPPPHQWPVIQGTMAG